jgi:putative PEP-CTERM system histidine kinase
VGYLCIGLGGMFAYDLALYAHATLLQDVSPELWYLRGLVNAAMTPFIAVAARRNTDWNFDIFVSRKVVFYSTTFVASGVYFIAMAVAGYYIRLRGGVWGSALTAVFILAAAAIFLAAIYSARVAGSWRVFLSKHFYRNKYEYRDEWLRLIGTLANDASGTPLRDRAVRAMAQIVGADSGVLWQRSEDGDYAPTGGWNTGDPGVVISRGEELVEFLLRRYWIVDTRELTRNPDHYGGLHLPASIAGKARRLIVPLLQNNDMPGFIVLDEPANTFELNYEDYDLLKTVGQQVASYLAEEQAEELLAQARQFEAYNKLTSFIMHDLKNVIAQQSLVVRNAAKFKHDPAFVEDTIRTIENSVDRMQHLLGLLQRGGVAEPRVASLAAVLDEVRAQCSNRSPVPLIQAPDRSLLVRVDSERLTAVIGHLVRNAQEATAKTGEVRLELLRVDDRAVIKVVDNGSGMDAEFVRRRLFRPFDTTKGAQGMGIGAFQAREFVRQSGGQLMVTSAVGVGTTITIELPLAVDAGAAARTSSGVR